MESSLGTGYDVSIAMVNLPKMPQLLPTNAALQAAVGLYLSCWARVRRGLPTNDVLDLTMYNKAIRCLSAALRDPEEQSSEATLCATFVLTKVEVSQQLCVEAHA